MTENISHERTITLTNERVNSDDLFKHCKELVILHNEDEYRLRVTGNGKLILTK